MQSDDPGVKSDGQVFGGIVIISFWKLKAFKLGFSFPTGGLRGTLTFNCKADSFVEFNLPQHANLTGVSCNKLLIPSLIPCVVFASGI